MDDLKLSHQRELDEHRRGHANAREKLQRFMEYTSSVEQERDGCRDALLTLVQKVEENNDLSTWPYSRIRLPEFLEPIDNDAKGQHNVNAVPQEMGVGEQAKAITLWLRAELEKERMSHARTHEQAEREIFALRAQLANREAELEACVVHRDHNALLNAALPGKTSRATSPVRESLKDDKTQQVVPSITPEHAVEILGLRVAKNRELENEIKQLSQKLHQARLKDTVYLDVERPVKELGGQRTPKSPDLRPLSPNDILSPYAMTPRYTSTPRAPGDFSHLPLRPPSIASESTVKGALTEIQKLEEEMRGLAAGIDVLEAQRRAAREFVERVRSPTPPSVPEEDVSSQHTAVQHESQPNATEALHAELDDVRRKAAQRETELLAEVARLQDELSRRALEQVPVVGPSLLDDDDIEKSMDLGSPLAPVTVLWADGGDTVAMTHQQNIPKDPAAPEPAAVAEEHPRPVTEQSHADVDMSLLIPLPASPTSPDPPPRSMYHRPPTPFASDSPDADPPTVCCACSARLATLERDLEETRRTVAQRDEELVDLQRALTELRLAVLRR